MKYILKITMLLMAGLVILSSCKKDDDTAAKQAEIDEQIIVDYLAANNIDAERDASGVYYLITDPGEGDQPNINSTIECYYKGYFTDGSIFDQSTQGPITYPLRNLITGWQYGIPYIKVGGSITLFIPSALGYGTFGSGSVPPNTVLIFDIDLIGVL